MQGLFVAPSQLTIRHQSPGTSGSLGCGLRLRGKLVDLDLVASVALRLRE